MYQKDTILALKEQRPDDEETGEPFPYNRVRVIGESPISHVNLKDGEKWTGSDAGGVIIVPLTNFGATLDEPFGKLRALYDVESIPEEEIPLTAPKVSAQSLPREIRGSTPEEVFAEKAPGVAPEDGQIRGRTPMSPLGIVENEAEKGPLDE